MPNRDPFAVDDYFTQDYVATIENMEFANNDYNNLQAVVTNRYDEPQLGADNELHASRTEWFNVGGSDIWVPTDGGSGFESASGDPDKRIRSNSGYGKLLFRALDLCGREVLLGRTDANAYAEGIYSNQMWIGMRFHWVTEGAGEKWENKKTGTSGVSKGSQLPVEWLPEGVDQAQLATFDVSGLGLDSDTLLDLATIAKGVTLGEFQGKGISIARDLQDGGLRSKVNAALSDPSFYETLRAS